MATSSPPPPQVVFPFGEPDPRLEDFLDDKLQSTADLATAGLDALLARVHEQQHQLRDQLEGAARELDDARAAAAVQHDALQAAVEQFGALEERIAKRMAVVENADTGPETVLEQLAMPMDQLHRVTLAHDYLVLLQDVATWAEAARTALPDRPEDALPYYQKIKRLSARLAELQTDDVAAPHLVAYVADVADRLWREMNATMRASFGKLLADRQWTVGKVDPAVAADATWRDAFGKLLALQAADVVAAATESSSSPQILLPVAVMADFFVLEFRYHFMALPDAGRQTSEPQRTGQLCFPWFLQRIDRWTGFMRRSFAAILKQQFQGTPAWLSTAYRDPACALAAALLPVLRQKVQHTVDIAVGALHEQRQQLRQQLRQKTKTQKTQLPELDSAAAADEVVLLNAPTFLGVFIGQLLEFDDELRQRGYDGGVVQRRQRDSLPSPTNDAAWPGLAGDVLDDDLFELWLRAEKEYAVARFRDTVDGDGKAALDARATIDYDYAPRGYTKPTRAAQHVVDLLRGLTAQYRRVRPFRHRRRFFIEIQITLLDQYHDRLQGTLEAYAAMTSTLGRTLQGFSFGGGGGGNDKGKGNDDDQQHQAAAQQQLLAGTLGRLEVLCRVFGSADLVADTLRGWSDEAFFVTLSHEVNVRAALASPGVPTALADDDDGLFGGNIRAYEALRDAAEAQIVAALVQSHSNALRPYILRTHWTTQAAAAAAGEEGDPEKEDNISPELDEPLRVVQRNLAFLARALGTVPLRRIVRKALLALEQQLFGELLLKSRFTGPGAAQFARDVAALQLVVAREVPVAAVAAGAGAGAAAATTTPFFEWLRQGTVLLTLPLTKSGDESILTLQEADDIMFRGARASGSGGGGGDHGGDDTNAGARQVLQQLGLSGVDEAHAHKIVRRRVELQ